ncbi:MAG TPA: glycosyltransferase family 9 protein [Candidatus Paceibacterota bacterium]
MEIKKALTFRASSIGDCLMGKYLLENIHAQFPNARLGIVVASRGAMIRDLFATYPWLEVIEANRRSPRSLFYLWRNFRNSDLVMTQYAGKLGGRFGLASKLAARVLAKYRGLIGFTDASALNRMLYDTLLSHALSDAPATLEREVLRALGVTIACEHPTMQCLPIPSATEKFGLVSGRYIVVHLFAGNTSRGLHPDKKRELLATLAKKLPDTRLVVSGGATDREEAQAIVKGLSATVIAGEATLQEMMNLISESRGVVSVDTGIAHITAQLGKPLVVLATCLGLHWWGENQYGAAATITLFTCSNLCKAGHVYKEYPDCMNNIDVEEVVQKISSL